MANAVEGAFDRVSAELISAVMRLSPWRSAASCGMRARAVAMDQDQPIAMSATSAVENSLNLRSPRCDTPPRCQRLRGRADGIASGWTLRAALRSTGGRSPAGGNPCVGVLIALLLNQWLLTLTRAGGELATPSRSQGIRQCRRTQVNLRLRAAGIHPPAHQFPTPTG